jgi:hypothetical protein
MEEPKQGAKPEILAGKHPAGCGCDNCYKETKKMKTKKVLINTAVLVVVFILGIIVGRMTGSGPVPRGGMPANFQGGGFPPMGGQQNGSRFSPPPSGSNITPDSQTGNAQFQAQ